MNYIEQTLEALKLCVSPETFNAAMAKVQNAPAPSDAAGHSKLEIMTQDLLTRFGISSNLKGYRFITTGVVLLVEEPDLSCLITKRLYPRIAEEYNTTASRVERGIRHAIEKAWENADIAELDKYFGRSVSYRKGQPTNSAFLVRVADLIRRNADQKRGVNNGRT